MVLGRLNLALAAIALVGCEKSLDPSIVTGEAVVREVGIQKLESFPVQVRAVVQGEFPDGCTRMHSVEQSRAGNEFLLHLSTARPRGTVCTEALEPFEEVVPLEVVGLDAGDYRVVANGVSASFTLTVDNR